MRKIDRFVADASCASSERLQLRFDPRPIVQRRLRVGAR
jgi:hypothetical protein